LERKISISIYIKAKRAGWLDVFVCVYVARQRWAVAVQQGLFFGVRSGGNDIFDIYDCCYAAGAFSLGSVLGPLLGNDRTFYPMSTGGFSPE
jgi:hypothetical protein